MEVPFTAMKIMFRRGNQEFCFSLMRDGCLTSKFLGQNRLLVDAANVDVLLEYVYMKVRKQRKRRNHIPSE